jgi:hypothetical protein
MQNSKTKLSILSLCTMCLLSGAYAQITPSADAYTNTAAASTNYGANVLLNVDGATETTYIQFNLASIPASASVSEATLKLYVNSVTTAGTFNVDYITGAWTESKITSNLAPALGAAIATSGTLTTASKNQYILINVTSAVQAWLKGSQANDGLALVANSTFNASFDSKENTTTSHPPELDIVFAGGGGSGITGITTASSSGLQGGGTSGTLNLSLTTSCSAGQILVWNGSAWACQTLKGSGTVTSVGLSAPSSDFTVTGSPVTASGALGLNWKIAPTSSDTNNAIVKRDSTGSFNATNISSSGSIAVNSAQTVSLRALSTAPGAYAIVGAALATDGQEYGVYGASSSTTIGSSGVFGLDNSVGANTPYTTGVAGTSANTKGGIGVFGYGSQLSVIAGDLLGSHSVGVWGDSPSVLGVWGTSDSGAGVFGFSSSGEGVLGLSTSSTGVAAQNSPSGTPTDSNATLVAINDSSTSQYVLYAENGSGSTYVRTDSGEGNLAATGNISGASQSFRIDHPLDPTGKYLLHADIESPEMKNLYDGVVQLDGRGEATVPLPDYFEAFNRDFRYQITSIGAPGPNLYIAQEISGNQFRIAGGQPGAKVSWQITGIRHDAWANANPLPVEVPKTGKEVGHYLHPHAFGQPDSMSTDYHQPRKFPSLAPSKQRAGLRPGQTQANSATSGGAASTNPVAQ